MALRHQALIAVVRVTCRAAIGIRDLHQIAGGVISHIPHIDCVCIARDADLDDAIQLVVNIRGYLSIRTGLS